MKRKSYKVNEVTTMLGIGRTSVYKLINSGKLNKIKIGSTTLISSDDVENLLIHGNHGVS